VLALEYEDLSFEFYTLTCQFGVCWSAFGKMGRPAIGQSPQPKSDPMMLRLCKQILLAMPIGKKKEKAEQAHAGMTKPNASEPNAIK
jgi:hypothetical protein